MPNEHEADWRRLVVLYRAFARCLKTLHQGILGGLSFLEHQPHVGRIGNLADVFRVNLGIKLLESHQLSWLERFSSSGFSRQFLGTA